MISDTLYKISNVIFASKLTNFLKTQLEAIIRKNRFNNRDYNQLSQQQQESLNSDIDTAIKQIDDFYSVVSKTLEKNVDKNFIASINKLIQTDGGSIYSSQSREQFEKTVEDYIKYKEFLNPQLQDITKVTQLSKIQDAILKYKQSVAVDEEKISKYKKAMQYGKYIVLQINDQDRQNFTSWLKGQANWCVLGGSWNRHERPYFLILQNYKPRWLVNVPTRQFRNLQNGAIKPNQLDDNLIKIMKQIFEKQYNGNYWYGKHYWDKDNLNVFVPYFPQDQIVQGIKNGRITDELFRQILKNAFKGNNSSLIEQLIKTVVDAGKSLDDFLKSISNENQFQTIMLKIYPNNNNENKQQWIKKNAKIHIDTLKQMLFNAFTSGKSGQGLFKRLLKFAPSQQNIYTYVQTDSYNSDLLYITFNGGKQFVDLVSTKNQLVLLSDLTKEITGSQLKIQKSKARNIFVNCCQSEIKDIPMIEFLLNYNLVQLDSYTIMTALDVDNDKIIKKLLEKDDSGRFNSPLYGQMLPIFYCIKQNKMRSLNELINSDKIDAKATANGRDIVWYAVQLQNEEILKSIIEKIQGFDFNRIYTIGVLQDHTLFSYYVKHNDSEMVDLLLKNNNVDINKLSPIDYAIRNNNISLVKKIIQTSRFNQYYKNENGDAPIMVAIKTDKSFELFKIFAAKVDLSKSELTNQQTKFTPLMLAVQNDMPFDLIVQYFDIKDVSYSNKKSHNVFDIIEGKLAIKPNDENMLKIKEWITSQNSTKRKSKQIDLEKQLKTFAYQNNLDAFNELLDTHSDEFDFSKNIDGSNLIYSFAANDSTSQYLKILLGFISNSNKYRSILKSLLQQQYNGFNAYDDASPKNKIILKPYYQSENIKVSSKQFKSILSFVKNYIR